MAFFEDIIVCPVCGGKIASDEHTLFCERKHSFDISSAGYVNFNVRHTNTGDSKEMADARHRFLDKGYYRAFACGIADTLESHKSRSVLDAGCGDGYYSVFAAQSAGDMKLIGFDLSKHSVSHAAKRARAAKISSRAAFFAAGIFELPVKSESADTVLNLFAPCAAAEFHRVLKKGGSLIMGAAGERHLLGLKKALYDRIYLNTPEKIAAPEGFNEKSRRRINYKVKIEGNDSIRDLFMMTPYYWKTGERDAQKLKSAQSLETELDFEIIVFEKI